jgi:hypothetical protein
MFISGELAATQVVIAWLRTVAHGALETFKASLDKEESRLLGMDVPGGGWIAPVHGLSGARALVAEMPASWGRGRTSSAARSVHSCVLPRLNNETESAGRVSPISLVQRAGSGRDPGAGLRIRSRAVRFLASASGRVCRYFWVVVI